MQFKSVNRFAVSALFVPVVGLAIFSAASRFNPARADSLPASNPILGQNTPDQTATPKKNWKHRGGKIFEQLNLTPDQKAQLKSIWEQSKTSTQGLRQQLRTAHHQLKTLLASNDASDDAIRQAHQQVQSLAQQISNQRFESRLKLRNVLTPEQRTKLAELHKQWGNHGHRRWHHHHPWNEGADSNKTAS